MASRSTDQATLEPSRTSPGNGKPPSASTNVREGIDGLLHDIMSLGELQAQLLMVDARDSVQKAQAPLVLLWLAVMVGLGAGTVLLMALAEALHEVVGWSRWLAFLASGGGGVVLSGLLMWLAWRQVGAITAVFNRSRDELAENVRWTKYALTHRSRPPR